VNRERLPNRRNAEGLTKAALKRGMNRLLKANRIHVKTTGPKSKQSKVLAPGPDPAKATEAASTADQENT
jgi:hypothetical protein